MPIRPTMDDFEGLGIYSWDMPKGGLAPGSIPVPGLVYHRAGRLRFRWNHDARLPSGVSEPEWSDKAARKKLGLPYFDYPSPQLLSGFLKLADASDDQIASFAGRWGPLYLCEHGCPANHNPGLKKLAPCASTCGALDDGGDEEGEPIAGWRSLSRIANAIVRLALELRNGKEGSQEDWRVALQKDGEVGGMLGGAPEAKMLWDAANAWVAIARFRPSVGIKERTWVIRFGTDSWNTALFGALAFQLLLRVTGPQKEWLCSSCGKPYAPKRRPAASRGNYCPSCGRRVAVRLAKERLRGRKRDALQLAASDGSSPEVISRLVGSRVKTVKGWLRAAKRRSRPWRAGPGN
jgi:DNA-directed RNA polymerase subunit RPC12/RpoP